MDGFKKLFFYWTPVKTFISSDFLFSLFSLHWKYLFDAANFRNYIFSRNSLTLWSVNDIESFCEWDIYEILALQMITFCVAYVDEERRREEKKKAQTEYFRLKYVGDWTTTNQIKFKTSFHIRQVIVTIFVSKLMPYQIWSQLKNKLKTFSRALQIRSSHNIFMRCFDFTHHITNANLLKLLDFIV